MSLPVFKKPTSVLPLITTGFYFGTLQTALYLSIEVFVTATFMGYFLLTLAWMCGVVFALKVKAMSNLFRSTILSLITFYTLLLLVTCFSVSEPMYAILCILIFVSAFPAGIFFKNFGTLISSNILFFHENNGFVFGIVISLLLFVKFGVHFIYYAPLAAILLMTLSLLEKEAIALSMVLLFALLFTAQCYWIGAIALAILFAILLKVKSLYPKSGPIAQNNSNGYEPNFSALKLKVIIFISGFNLMLLQYFIVREFSTIISANELSILLVSAAYFIGFSVGYALSSRISFAYLKIISFVMFFIHLMILTGIKWIASYFIFKGFNLETLLLLLFVTSFLTSSFYSIFLPKCIQLKGSFKLAEFYSIEILGAAAGVLTFVIVVAFGKTYLFPIYFLMFVLLYFILFDKSKWAASALFIGLYVTSLFTIHQNELRNKTTLDYYQVRGYANPKLLFSDNSYYHAVDVIETYTDEFQTEKQSKISFLNGQKYFDYNYSFLGKKRDETSLSEFTYFLARLPAQYQFEKINKKIRVLILGGGSLYSISRVAPFSAKTTMVEIDPVVIASSKKWWREFNKFDQYHNYEIIVDDAKRYLKQTDERFDLIIMDISAPYYLGSALLHNKEFFELVKRKLKPEGIFSESTQGRPEPNFPESTSMKILSAIHEVFPKYYVIDCKAFPRGERGFVFASEQAPISSDKIIKQLNADDKLLGTALFSNEDKRFNFASVKPYSLYSMENLWEGNLHRIKTMIKQQENRRNKINFYSPHYLHNVFFNDNVIGLSSIALIFALLLRFYPMKK